MAIVRAVRLTCIDYAKNHNKFYELIQTSDHKIISLYGPIGKVNPPITPTQLGNKKEADNYFENMRDSKIKKGYKVDSMKSSYSSLISPFTGDTVQAIPVKDTKKKTKKQYGGEYENIEL